MKVYLIVAPIVMLCMLFLPTVLNMSNSDTSPEIAAYGIISSGLVTLFVALANQTKSKRKMLIIWSITILGFLISANLGLALAFWIKDFSINMRFLLMINSGIVIVAIVLGAFGLVIQRLKCSGI